MAGPLDSLDDVDFKPAFRLRVPPGVRYRVLIFALALGAITYLDRVCISHKTITASIIDELGLTRAQMGYVFSAFTLAYGLFEMPTGAWGDRIGTRRVLTRIVVWWSSFTILTAAAFNYISLLIIRFLFGAGEAGAFPNVAKTFSRWFPITERGTIQGIFFAAVHLGGGLTYFVVSGMLLVLPWRGVFVVCGLIGFVWAAWWFVWFRDEPADHPEVSEEERKYIESGRYVGPPHRLDLRLLGRMLTDRSLIALCLMYFTQAYGMYFVFTWLPTYLADYRGLTESRVGWFLASLFAGLPMILAAGADVLGGVTTDRLTRSRGLRVGRCGVGAVSLLVASGTLLAGATTSNPYAAAILIALSAAADSFLLASCWSVCQEISGPHAGLVAACMNTAGQAGGFLSPIVFAQFADPVVPLCIASGLFLFGAVCWLFVDPRRQIHLPPPTAEEHPDPEPNSG